MLGKGSLVWVRYSTATEAGPCGGGKLEQSRNFHGFLDWKTLQAWCHQVKSERAGKGGGGAEEIVKFLSVRQLPFIVTGWQKVEWLSPPPFFGTMLVFWFMPVLAVQLVEYDNFWLYHYILGYARGMSRIQSHHVWQNPSSVTVLCRCVAKYCNLF